MASSDNSIATLWMLLPIQLMLGSNTLYTNKPSHIPFSSNIIKPNTSSNYPHFYIPIYPAHMYIEIKLFGITYWTRMKLELTKSLHKRLQNHCFILWHCHFKIFLTTILINWPRQKPAASSSTLKPFQCVQLHLINLVVLPKLILHFDVELNQHLILYKPYRKITHVKWLVTIRANFPIIQYLYFIKQWAIIIFSLHFVLKLFSLAHNIASDFACKYLVSMTHVTSKNIIKHAHTYYHF